MTKTSKFRFDIVLWPILRTLRLFGWRPKRVSCLLLAVRDLDRWLTGIARHHNDFIAAKTGKAAYQAGIRVALGLAPLEQSGLFWVRTRPNSSVPSRLWRIFNLLNPGVL